MATDMAVNTATWGTASLLLASGDAIDGATGFGWGSQVAKNTGFLYYQPRAAHAAQSTITAGDSETLSYGYVYVPAGVYSIYGHAKTNKDDAPEGTLLWDGTNLVVFSSDEAATGSLCGWTQATAGWVLVSLTGSADSADTLIQSAVAYRFGSWAP